MHTLAILAAFSAVLSSIPAMTWNDANPNAQSYGPSLTQPCGFVLRGRLPVMVDGELITPYYAIIGSTDTPYRTLSAARARVETACSAELRKRLEEPK